MSNLKLNDPYVNFLLPSTDGNKVSLDMAELGEYKLVIFSCNHCPYAQAWEDRIIKIQEKYKSNGLSIIMISSNDALKYPEDSFPKMKERHEEKGFNFHYLLTKAKKLPKCMELKELQRFFFLTKLDFLNIKEQLMTITRMSLK